MTFRQQTWLQRALRRFTRQRVGMGAALAVMLLVFVALFASLIARHDPAEQFRGEGRDKNGLPVGPSQKFWLGADGLQRDLYSRLVFGARTSLTVGVFASFLSVIVGLAWGSAAALLGGRADNLMMRAVDIIMSLPLIVRHHVVHRCAATTQPVDYDSCHYFCQLDTTVTRISR